VFAVARGWVLVEAAKPSALPMPVGAWFGDTIVTDMYAKALQGNARRGSGEVGRGRTQEDLRLSSSASKRMLGRT
jgi:hypothetical protein